MVVSKSNGKSKESQRGCDGLMIEVHNNPEKALCDGPQSLKPAKFEQLMKELKPIADAVGKEL